MDLFKTLKQFQKIEPDEGFKKTSLNLIFGEYQSPAKPNVFGIILKNLELGAGLALAGLLIFMIIGGFSAWKFLSPLQIANLDPAGLRAEARAIDIQIQLTNLNYSGVVSSSLNETTLSAIAGTKKATSGGGGGGAQSITPLNSTSTSISIDEALQKLSE